MKTFYQFMEANNPKPFLQSALEEFPNSNSLMIMADALQDDGEDDLADAIRYLIQNRGNQQDPKITQQIEALIRKVANELAQHRIYPGAQSGIVRHEDGSRHNIEYAWRGNTLVVNRSQSGSANWEVIDVNEIQDPNIVKALALSAAVFFLQSHSTPHGLADYRTTRRTLNKQGQAMATQDSEVRHAIREFLISFESFEEYVRIFNRSQRIRNDDLREAERLINYRGYGYQWHIPETEQILRRFVQTHGSTPFLNQLGVRIHRAMNLIPNRIQADERMVTDIERIAGIIRDHNFDVR